MRNPTVPKTPHLPGPGGRFAAVALIITVLIGVTLHRVLAQAIAPGGHSDVIGFQRYSALIIAGGLTMLYLALLAMIRLVGHRRAEQERELSQAIMEQARAEEVLRRQNKYMEALQAATLATMSRLDLSTLLGTIIARVGEVLDAPHGYAALVEPEEEVLAMVAGTGLFAERIGNLDPIDVGVAGRVWHSGRPLMVENYRTWVGRNPAPAFDRIQVLAGAPITSAARVVGVLGLAQEKKGLGFGPAEIAVLSQFAELASLALDNARLHAEAQRELEERRSAEAALEESAATFRLMFASNPHPMWVYDVYTLEFLEVNQAAIDRYGYGRDEFLRMQITDIRPPEEVAYLLQDLANGASGTRQTGEWRHRHKDGHIMDVEVNLHTLRFGKRESALVVAQDVTERKRAERELVHLANHDPLTGLFNRRRFHEELDRELARARRSDASGAVLFLDIDQFKYVNDTLGHHVGDELLVAVARLLRTRLRESDVLARLGGDEFAILLRGVDAEAVKVVAEQLLDALRQHTTVIAGQPVNITASLGASLFPQHSVAASDLLAFADLVMYQVKENGRNGFGLYVPGDAQAQIAATLTWERRIREALDQSLFTLYAQPIRDLKGDEDGYELLLRLRGEGEVFLPGAFLDVAERSGLIRAIDRWVVRRAIALVAEQSRRGRPCTLSVNLSGKSLGDGELLLLIQRELATTGIDPRRLIFEITETAVITNIDEARQFMATLRRLGCIFALDDFGVGFSSFYYLKHLPVDFLKIDGGFIQNLAHDTVDQQLVKAMVAAARGLGKQTVAEFVVDEATLRLVQALGVDHAQGYYIGIPRPVEEVFADLEIHAA